MTNDNDNEIDYVEYQRNEIEQAKEDIGERYYQIANAQHGLLIGGELPTETELYLRGYIDALDFAEAQVAAIKNLAKYAFEEGQRVANELNGESDE